MSCLHDLDSQRFSDARKDFDAVKRVKTSNVKMTTDHYSARQVIPVVILQLGQIVFLF